MSENQMQDAIVEVLKERSKDIYDDGLKPVTKESGEALQAIVGLFNNVVLYPIKKANITFKYKLEQFEQDLWRKIATIPAEKLIEPPLNIAGPTIEALKYTFDTQELREMYMNLISSSMSSDTVIFSHPGYVEIIKQMSQLDAIVFKNMSKLNSIPCSRIQIGFGDKIFSFAIPKIFAPDINEDYDPFLISSSLENLCRLGLITHRETSSIIGYDYKKLVDHKFIQNQFELLKKYNPELSLYIKSTEEVLLINDFGQNFAKTCL
jgi:hypothetical protein